MKLDKVQLHMLDRALNQKFDLYICSSSFEERCLSIPKNIDVHNIGQAMILSNIDLEKYVGGKKESLKKIFHEKITVDVCTNDPILTADNLDKYICNVVSNKNLRNILLDITTFTHESLLILLCILRLHCRKAKIVCVYANASEYSVGDDVGHKWLSRGIGEVRSILGYPGEIVPSRETHLILIVGYEHERAAGLVEALEPNSLSIGYGRSGSATTEKDKDANESYMQLVEQIATSYYDVSRFEISCNDPIGTKNMLLTQIDNVKNKNIVVAPMNNKLTTIGAALAAFQNDKIQMCYAQALRYNHENYAAPGSDCYIFNLSFGDDEI
ncbi:MAG: hypothetical protein KQJ78_21155 [Deltaproteobacteria bacterium]|nr:hypothetical protein [Deltaproteobacteria bacterium]